MRSFWPFNKKKGPPKKPDQERRTGPGTGLSVHDAVDAIRDNKRKKEDMLRQL